MVEYGNRWGQEGPPPEAYSRVSNPERFRPLHDVADAVIAQLERDFQLQKIEAYGIEPRIEQGVELVRPPIKLDPNEAGAAPIIFGFTSFPGVTALLGRWHIAAFPRCGCDACDETAEDQKKHLRLLVEAVTSGHFREALVRDSEGVLLLQHELNSSEHRSSGSMRIEEEHIPMFVGEVEEGLFDWAP